MSKYTDEVVAFEDLERAITSAVGRTWTDLEVRHIKWLARMEWETIEVFVNLFKDVKKI